jgi:hypothetical protein
LTVCKKGKIAALLDIIIPRNKTINIKEKTGEPSANRVVKIS